LKLRAGATIGRQGEHIHEDDLSAEETAEKEGARFSQAHEDEKRQARLEAQERQRQEISFRVVGKVSSREASMFRPDVLRNKRDFDRLYKKGAKTHSRYLVIIFAKNGGNFNRKAFLASKKVGKAVARNRARRLMKESFRNFAPRLKTGYDILFIARNTIVDASCPEVAKTMKISLTKSNLFK
jgi:ribonuclease P protein component